MINLVMAEMLKGNYPLIIIKVLTFHRQKGYTTQSSKADFSPFFAGGAVINIDVCDF